MHIIHIEPDTVLAKTYASALQLAGHTVTNCGTAQAGITAADERKPDAVLLELQLVEHSGIEFLYEFRSYPEWQRIPVIILSAVPPTEFANSQRLLHDELAIHAYYYKPQTSLQTLLQSLQALPVAV